MNYVSFDEWLAALRRCAQSYGVELSDRDMAHYDYYDRGDTPYGAITMIRDFGYEG